MILGVGVDVVDVAAFREQLADAASRFATGVFTIGERQAAASRASGDAARHLAARFAAKEAFVKAWSTARFGRPPAWRAIDLRSIEVIQDAWGRPALRFDDALSEALRAAAPWRAHVSLSHDGAVAIATVLLEGAGPLD
ncbi:MAG: holo-ACP synthase [Myxococcales bacterium]|nr:holo-ACP synthase [Myxococcales bacterium]